jgi:hypothetical protein
VEKLATDKHSSLLQRSVNYGCKKVYSTGAWSGKRRKKILRIAKILKAVDTKMFLLSKLKIILKNVIWIEQHVFPETA